MPMSEGQNTDDKSTDLKTTPLHALHLSLGAKMVPFAGYDMPVQYPAGVKTEHLHTRAKAGLFDVSHMGQVRLTGDGAAADIETLIPGDIQALSAGRMRYTMFTNPEGGILDDLIVTNAGDHLFVVVNAGCKEQDIAHMRANLSCGIEELPDRALLALQGPSAEAVLASHAAEVADMKFMTARAVSIAGHDCFVTRSGYTGEDGYEISVPGETAAAFAEMLLAHPDVEPIGLGARDSLRLEAGLCLYGHDIDETTTPVEANLTWAINKRRRVEGGFPGSDKILGQLADGALRRRVGIRLEGRAPAREGTELVDDAGTAIGHITSGGFGPTLEGPVAMGYVDSRFSETGCQINAMVRGKPLPARVAALPFVAANYKRG
jgi:aminomethyltransferase